MINLYRNSKKNKRVAQTDGMVEECTQIAHKQEFFVLFQLDTYSIYLIRIDQLS